MSSQRGPRAARGQVRERLLKVARSHFWTKDYGDVKVRDIAEEAGVDPALINYYFKGKTNLFRESMLIPNDPIEIVADLFDGDRDTLGYRAVLGVLTLWEESEMSSTAKVLVRSILGSESTFADYRVWLDEAIITPSASKLGGPNAKYRVEAGLAHILGIVAIRYITQLEPLASMPREDVARMHGPIVQGIFTGQLTGRPRTR
ncbi:MAG: TetR family transcriptional regulator [Flaviflexus sp.]|uniref:TetR/AcrR family transcriptional regulator n=1 Tax=Flaviflexus sp. TaxID=1969482 RepID=UPI00352D8516